ncbi:MAG: Xaa-Pro peptidase family protein [Acidobacteria bacterium]|nr:Xaa-Pro peptidase family protein [Acidobacteriota bacterium]
MSISRRDFFRRTTAATAGALTLTTMPGCVHPGTSLSVPEPISSLDPPTGKAEPISDDERHSRVEKARRLMIENDLDAIFLDAGSSLFYFTGVRWHASERMLAAVLPARGEIGWVCPAFEEQRLREFPGVGDDVRTWQEHESPYRRVAQFLSHQGIAGGRIGVEERARFFLYDGMRQLVPAAEFASADPVTAGCRMIKSAAELALMQHANDITITAYRAVLQSLREGMTRNEFNGLCATAFRALGVEGGAFGQFGEGSALPHGSSKPRALREGDVVLMDGGCSVEGYRSDISRTTVFGRPSQRQRDVWDLERKAQDAALAAAQPGAACEDVDAAARKVIVEGGFGPDYEYFTHRVGHGIGLDGHEWTYLVRGNKTPLAPGMCFSNEPGIYIQGEFGVRLEDCMTITEDGARLFTRQSPAIDEPFAS